MKTSLLKPFTFVMGVGILLCAAIFAMRAKPNAANTDVVPSPPVAEAGTVRLSDRQMQKAHAMIARSPSSPDGYNLLCSAFMQQVRETGDFSLTAKAEAALDQSFKLSPDNQETIKLQATLLLTYHRFGEALTVACRAQQLSPQDHEIYGALTDAFVELGRYDEADQAVKKMMSLRPDASSYARASYLNFLHGESEGAIRAMYAAAQAESPQDAEGFAWCRVHLGDELLKTGHVAEAEHQIDFALELLPDYYLGLAAKARARSAAGDLAGAVEFYKRAEERVPLPDTAIALGDLYTLLGQPEEAKRQYQLVEFIEQSSATANTYSHQLALFWANHDQRLDEALAIAQRDRQARADIYTCDALAWCLLKKGQNQGAKRSIDEAMRLGTHDALIYYHAGMIYNALGDHGNAVKYLNLALSTNPTFDMLQSAVARRVLEGKPAAS